MKRKKKVGVNRTDLTCILGEHVFKSYTVMQKVHTFKACLNVGNMYYYFCYRVTSLDSCYYFGKQE